MEEEEAVEAEEDEEGSGDMLAGINNLRIETAGTEEEAAEGVEELLQMEGVEDEGIYREEGGVGTQRALEALELLAQDADLSGTTLVDACNWFNKQSRLAMLWTVQHRWTAGARFTFNCYKQWAQLII